MTHAAPEAFTPFERSSIRFQVNVTVGIHTISQNAPTLEIAQGVVDRFAKREAGNKEAFAYIYDRSTKSVVSKWKGAPKRIPLPTLTDIYAKLIARGDSVLVADGSKALSFNEGRG